MTIALIDNGSLEPDAHRNLRAVALGISQLTGETVHAVSWKHSSRIPGALLDGLPADTLVPWIKRLRLRGEREFLFVPFFISDQGAIGSALRVDLEKLQASEGAFEYAFTDSLATTGALIEIAAERIKAAAGHLDRSAVIVVDHGGPSAASAALRDRTAGILRSALGDSVRGLAAASMEGGDYPHNRPLLADQLRAPGFDTGRVVIAPLFLSPGRHAGPDGDLRQITRAAEAASPGLTCTFAELIGTHPLATQALAHSLRQSLRLPSIL